MLRIRSAALLAALALATGASAQLRPRDMGVESPCCDIQANHVVWVGDDPEMTLEELAAYCAPILWFSPDEPLLRGRADGEGIDIPTHFPFDAPAEGPVVHYRVRTLITGSAEDVLVPDAGAIGSSVIRLDRISGIELDYFFYYPSEEGLGRHDHDTESIELKVAVWFQEDCDECRYGITVEKVTAKAHGVLWYDNSLICDANTSFPLTILVEEGKHASCTDKNGDGVYTPGYDVNVRINDAWGVRDILREGVLFSGRFESWFAKRRQPGDRVFPPLPADARARDAFAPGGDAAPGEVRYSLRPMPPVEKARAHPDATIMRFADKGFHDWPYVRQGNQANIVEWIESEEFVKSVSVAARIDRNVGVSVVFPFFVFKNLYLPLTGGWLVNRVYLTDRNFRDVGYNVIFTNSASRWIDGYFSLGVEWDTRDEEGGGRSTRAYMASEAGIKLRGNVVHSPLSWMGRITEFWGVRTGIRYLGATDFKRIGYVVEIGAGAF